MSDEEESSFGGFQTFFSCGKNLVKLNISQHRDFLHIFTYEATVVQL